MLYCAMQSNVTERVENQVKSYVKHRRLLIQHQCYGRKEREQEKDSRKDAYQPFTGLAGSWGGQLGLAHAVQVRAVS